MEQKYSSKLDLIRCPAFSHTNVMRSIHPNKSICDIFMWNFDFKSLIRAHFSKEKKNLKGEDTFPISYKKDLDMYRAPLGPTSSLVLSFKSVVQLEM